MIQCEKVLLRMHEKYQLIPIDKGYRNMNNLLQELSRRQRVRLVDVGHIGLIPFEIIVNINKLRKDSLVLILNQELSENLYPGSIDPNFPFPLCAINKRDSGRIVVPKDEALVIGNYLLCIGEKDVIDRYSIENPIEGPQRYSGYEYPYQCHVNPETFLRWHNPAPYVNLYRDSDSIGYSSWDGNLVSWFRCQYGTRIQYGVHAGLFPEE
jgi:hypothetical protein